jgi:fumarate reductase subunit C
MRNKTEKTEVKDNENYGFYLILGTGIGAIFFVISIMVGFLFILDGASWSDFFKSLYITGFFCGIFAIGYGTITYYRETPKSLRDMGVQL